jgi:hypothetical protein
MAKLIINNINNNPLWKKIPCKCDKSDIEKSYPLITCIHCNCEKANSSIPTETFTVNDDITKVDEDGNITVIKEQTKTIKEITLMNCKTYGSPLGWSF